MPAGGTESFLKQSEVDGCLPSFGYRPPLTLQEQSPYKAPFLSTGVARPCKRPGSALEDPKPTGGLLLLNT